MIEFSLFFWLEFPGPTAKAQVCVNQHDSTEVAAATLTYTENMDRSDTKYTVYRFYWQVHVYRLEGSF